MSKVITQKNHISPYLYVTVAILVFFVLYSPQPLLPMFASHYGLNEASAGMLMTATFIPLALAPLLYGFLLEKITPTLLLKWVLFGLGLTTLLFASADSFLALLSIRFLLGLLIPAALTAMTTNIAHTSAPNDLQHNMSLFIAGTILGGMFGRVLSGLFATYLSWQMFYVVLALALLTLAVRLHLSSSPKPIAKPTTCNTNKSNTKTNVTDILSILRQPAIHRLYIAIFCLFFCFVAVMNYLPFIVQSLVEKSSNAMLGMMYSGYIVGVVVSLKAKKVAARLSVRTAMLLGYAIFTLSLLGLLVEHAWFVFTLIFVICAGIFLVHALANAEVNRHYHPQQSQDQQNQERLAANDTAKKPPKDNKKGMINALYLTYYYTGGLLGSYLPGLVYQHYGLQAFVVGLFLVALIGGFALLGLNKQAYP